MITSPLRQTFHATRVVLPVVHVKEPEQAVRNVRIAWEAGADGVFLVNHEVSTEQLLAIHAQVVERVGMRWIGVNCLGERARDCFARLSHDVGGLWVDDAGIERRAIVQVEAKRAGWARAKSGWSGLYFGGVPVAPDEPVERLRAVVANAQAHVDVVALRGRDGRVPPVATLEALWRGRCDVPLAIAGGITLDNVEDYLPWVHCVIVGRGVSRDFYRLDPLRVARLVAKVRAHADHSRRLPGRYDGMTHPAEVRRGHRVTLVGFTHGAVFEIDPSAFPEPEPMFAYWDDWDDWDVGVDQLQGLQLVGELELSPRRNREPRRCLLLRATADAAGGICRLRSLAVGEFDLELYHVPPDGAPELLWSDDFIFK